MKYDMPIHSMQRDLDPVLLAWMYHISLESPSRLSQGLSMRVTACILEDLSSNQIRVLPPHAGNNLIEHTSHGHGCLSDSLLGSPD